MRSMKWVLLAGLGLVLMAGCGSTPEKPAEEGVTTQPTEAPPAVPEQQPADMGASVTTYSLDDPNSPLANRVIYFDYDSANVREQDRVLVELHARYLADHPGTQLILEGHTDERGSREYNIALGERRANAVLKLLQLLGANAPQLQALSFGEERPVALAHDESAWSLNRRVELVYTAHR